MVCSFGNCRDTLPEVFVRAEKFKMAPKMAVECKRTELSLGSLKWIFVNRVTVKITCGYSSIYIRILNDKES